MAKYKPCNYDQLVMLPISLEAQLVPGSLEHTINEDNLEPLLSGAKKNLKQVGRMKPSSAANN